MVSTVLCHCLSIDWPSTHLNDLLHTSQMKASAFGSVRLDVELDIVSACRAGSAAGGIVPNRLPDDDASINRSLAACLVSACSVNIIIDIAYSSEYRLQASEDLGSTLVYVESKLKPDPHISRSSMSTN